MFNFALGLPSCSVCINVRNKKGWPVRLFLPGVKKRIHIKSTIAVPPLYLTVPIQSIPTVPLPYLSVSPLPPLLLRFLPPMDPTVSLSINNYRNPNSYRTLPINNYRIPQSSASSASLPSPTNGSTIDWRRRVSAPQSTETAAAPAPSARIINYN